MEIKQRIESEIDEFKKNIKHLTSWDTGKDIREFIDVDEALAYGRLLGKRDMLEELQITKHISKK